MLPTNGGGATDNVAFFFSVDSSDALSSSASSVELSRVSLNSISSAAAAAGPENRAYRKMWASGPTVAAERASLD